MTLVGLRLDCLRQSHLSFSNNLNSSVVRVRKESKAIGGLDASLHTMFVHYYDLKLTDQKRP